MGGLVNAIFGNGETTNTTQVGLPPPSADEQALISLNTQLAQKQLANIDQLQPFQQQLVDYSLQQLKNQQAYDQAFNAAVTPEQQAAAAKQQFDLAQQMGPIQAQLLQMQLDQLKTGGAATDEQKARIADATNTAITAGTGDIDTQTQRGIGLISDELANSRGLRLSDSPIGSEAALLVRAAGDQKSSLINNLRANQASATLNYPLAVQGLQSGVNLSQQNLTQAAQNFQSELRQRAYQNRLALSGQASTSGIGLSAIPGLGTSALNTQAGIRLGAADRYSTGFDPNAAITSYGKLFQGIGGMMATSDRRLKADIERVGALESGIPLYRFRYKGERKVHIGVMADEVLPVIPEAVHMDSRGYYMVNYAALK